VITKLNNIFTVVENEEEAAGYLLKAV
jgi:hypothetical protein